MDPNTSCRDIQRWGKGLKAVANGRPFLTDTSNLADGSSKRSMKMSILVRQVHPPPKNQLMMQLLARLRGMQHHNAEEYINK